MKLVTVTKTLLTQKIFVLQYTLSAITLLSHSLAQSHHHQPLRLITCCQTRPQMAFLYLTILMLTNSLPTSLRHNRRIASNLLFQTALAYRPQPLVHCELHLASRHSRPTYFLDCTRPAPRPTSTLRSTTHRHFQLRCSHRRRP